MDLTGDAAPWWFVGALAGFFTVIGGMISIGGSWLNDLIKSRRDRKRSREAETLEAGAQVLADSGAIRHQALLSLNRTDKQWHAMLAGSAMSLVDRLELSTSRLVLIAPKEVIEPTRELLGMTMLLVVPLFDVKERKGLIKQQILATQRLRNAIRKYRGLPDLGEMSEKSFLDNVDDIAAAIRDHVSNVEKGDS